jgi:outer membrane lipoprotein-sorting protein
MKTTFLCVIALLTLLLTSGSAQEPAANNDQRLLALIKEVQTQQVQITANQDKIDTKVAEIAEAIRVARIFAGRGGH